MSTIDKRISELEQFRERQERRKAGPVSFFQEVRRMLQGIDGQADFGALPGESLMDVMARRMMHLDGWNLNALPGSTEDERWHGADLAAHGKLAISDEIKHAARHCIKVYQGI